MEALFLKILNMSISAGWLVLAVVVLRLVLKKAPKAIRVVLWGIVGLRLIWPFSIESILSLIPSAETVPADIGLAAEPAIHSGVPFVNRVVNPVLGSSLAATPQYSINPMQILQFIAAWVWVIGMAVMAVYALVSWMVVRYRVREAARENGNIWLCDHVGSPFILGIFRPRIYLPSAMSDADKGYVLAHERAHLHRRDHWWKPLGFLLLTVHWFNPLVWLAYILLCRDIELACDEKVMAQLGEEGKKPYSQALINCSVPRRMIAACPLAFGETGVKGRIRSVLNYKKPAFWIVLVAVIACIAVTVCFLTDPKQPDADQILTSPPELWVSDGSEQSIKAWQGGYSWSYDQDGETVYTIADADHPTAAADKLPRIGLVPDTISSRKSNTVLLDFGEKPDSISVVAHAMEATSSAGGKVEATMEAFELLEGEYIYVIEAGWEDHGTAQYAFVGSFSLPVIQVPDMELEQLRQQYPQYFDLPTDKGLEVFIWQMAQGSYSCALLPGRNLGYTNEEIWALHKAPLSIEEMRMVLTTYDLDRSEIFLMPVQMPHSSYWYEINDSYRRSLEKRFWVVDEFGLSLEMQFTSATQFRLILRHTSRLASREGDMVTGADFAVAKYGLDGEPELLVSVPIAAWDALAYQIPTDGEWEREHDLQPIYGTLPPGTYQLQKTVYITEADGTSHTRIYTADFAITEE